MKLALPTSLALALLTLGAGSVAAAPPKGATVIKVAGAAQPPPSWAEASYLEIGAPGHPARISLRVSLSPTGAIRQDLQDLGPTGSLSSQVWAPVGAAAAGAERLDDAPGWIQVLAGRSLDAVLRAKRVDAGVTSLAHDGATILWVLGAGPHAPDAPQVHVERETGRLRQFTERLPGPPGPDGSTTPERVVAVRLSGGAADTGERAAWPARVEIAAGGRVVTLALQSLTVGEPLDARRFVIEPVADPAPEGLETPPAPVPPSSPEPDPRGTTL